MRKPRSRLQKQVERNVASYRLQMPDQKDLAWKQWGVGIVTTYPRERWAERIAYVPAVYRDLVRSRIISDYGLKIEG